MKINMSRVARHGELEAFDFWKLTKDGRWLDWWMNRSSQIEFWQVIAQNGEDDSP